MSWLLSSSVRRIIALLLLVLDLSQEPGSALEFTSIADDDSDTVADLCTKENFSWTVAGAIEDATPSTRDVVCGLPLVEHPQRVTSRSILAHHRTILPAHFEFVLAPNIPFEIALSLIRAPRFGEASNHGNTYLAHQRSTVLII
jgi:hypothetical protein